VLVVLVGLLIRQASVQILVDDPRVLLKASRSANRHTMQGAALAITHAYSQNEAPTSLRKLSLLAFDQPRILVHANNPGVVWEIGTYAKVEPISCDEKDLVDVLSAKSFLNGGF